MQSKALHLMKRPVRLARVAQLFSYKTVISNLFQFSSPLFSVQKLAAAPFEI
jgi:hypothetical protein